jgi:Skp family chaperone for outer membrane proteins
VSRSHLLAAVAVVVLVTATLLSVILSGPAVAQQPAARPAGQPQPQSVRPVVALLDVSYVFKNHARLKTAMDAMKQDVAKAEAWVNGERDALTKLTDRLKDFRQGSQDYKTLEEDIARRQTELTLKVQQQRRDFLQHEAKLYYTVYQEIQQEVNYYCSQTGVATVLRFSRDPVDAENPDSVLAYINKPVIAYAANLDISDVILEQLNRGSASTVGSQPRPGVPYR